MTHEEKSRIIAAASRARAAYVRAAFAKLFLMSFAVVKPRHPQADRMFNDP